MKSIFSWSDLLIVLVFGASAGACSSSSSGGNGADTPTVAVGPLCDGNGACSNGTSCGSEGDARSQCTIPCSGSGGGAAVGCPEGTYCTRYTEHDARHFCARLCANDGDCHAFNEKLSCEPAYSDDGGSGPSACVNHN